MSVPLIVGGATVVALDLARRFFRAAHLFLPTRDPVKSWNPADYGIALEHAEEMWIETSDGEKLHAWYLRAKNPIASALYCHGNTGNLTNVAHLMPHMLESGIYLGPGASRPEPVRGNVIRDNEISGHKMKSRCIVFGPGVSRAANTIEKNTCSDLEPAR